MVTKVRPLTMAEMPRDDVGACMWLRNFVCALNEQPGLADLIGVGPERLEQIARRTSTFEEAYRNASAPSTRTPVTVQLKNRARNEVVLALRDLVRDIKANPMVSDVHRLNLGIKPRGAKRRR